MRIEILRQDILKPVADLTVVFCTKRNWKTEESLKRVDQILDGQLFPLMEQMGFEGGAGDWFVLPTLGRLPAKVFAVAGLGEQSHVDADRLRKAGAFVQKRAREMGARTIVTHLFEGGRSHESVRDYARAFAEGLHLGAYRFYAYKSKGRDENKKQLTERIQICERVAGRVNALTRGMQEGEMSARCTMTARDLVNTSAAEMHPAQLAEIARRLATEKNRISIEIISAAEMAKLGMGGVLAVGRGSEHAPIGVHLTYRPSGKSKKRVALVGKAITFDSGGLSLKTADSMVSMKYDMAGAAAVLGVFEALPKLKPQVEVHGIFLAAENMPSGHAYHPGDVVKIMNGTTVEVLNTDAEGRLTLADALCFAERLQPDVIIDLATLTGACVVALGEDIAGLMSNDPRLASRLMTCGRSAGETIWELPLHAPYRELIKSKVADFKNSAGRQAGAITAGLFLASFINKTPWAHIDIAGPSYTEKETRPDISFGGTGFGVRMLLRYLESLG